MNISVLLAWIQCLLIGQTQYQVVVFGSSGLSILSNAILNVHSLDTFVNILAMPEDFIL